MKNNYFKMCCLLTLFLLFVNDICASVSLEKVPAKLQNKLFVFGAALIPVSFMYVGIYYMSGSQEAKTKLTQATIGAILVLGATAIVSTIKGII